MSKVFNGDEQIDRWNDEGGKMSDVTDKALLEEQGWYRVVIRNERAVKLEALYHRQKKEFAILIDDNHKGTFTLDQLEKVADLITDIKFQKGRMI